MKRALRFFRLSNIRALPIVATAAALFCSPQLFAQESVFTLDPSKSTIEFTLGASLHTVHGTFRLKRGEIHFDPAKGTATGAIVVDALSGESGNEGRDKKMHQEILESPKFSEIIFIPRRVQGTIAPQGTSQVSISGVMKLHGQDHEMTLNFAVQPGTPGQAQAATTFSVPYVKWGLKNPSTFLLRVTDSVDVDVHASGQLTLASPHQ
ncbi:MAG: YceI family protein [Candidatus Acidiferrales bacterium]